MTELRITPGLHGHRYFSLPLHKKRAAKDYGPIPQILLKVPRERLKKINFDQIKWTQPDSTGRRNFNKVEGKDLILNADLVLLAMGFVHVEHGKMVKELDIKTDSRGNIIVDGNYKTSHEGFFATGDSILGASLVVKAINAGRRVAAEVNNFLAVSK